MKVNAITIRPGNVLEYNDKLMLVTKIDLIQPGKGNAVIQVEMKDMRTGTKDNQRFRTQETVERARLDDAEMQFLFHEGEQYTFMDVENFEQHVIEGDTIGPSKVFLKEGMVCTVKMHEGTPITADLPSTVVLEVVESEPVVKGQTASSSYKPAIVSNGVKVMVPPHIEVGTRIVVNTADSSYLERSKE